MGHVNRRPGNAVFAGWLGRAGGSSSPSGGLYHRRVIRRENPGHRHHRQSHAQKMPGLQDTFPRRSSKSLAKTCKSSSHRTCCTSLRKLGYPQHKTRPLTAVSRDRHGSCIVLPEYHGVSGCCAVIRPLFFALDERDQLESRRVTESPILPSVVQGLQGRIIERPAASHSRVSLVNLLE